MALSSKRRGQRNALLIAAAIAVASCSPPADPVANPLLNPPLSLELNETDVQAWGYRKEMRADLDADGTTEVITLASDVSMTAAGAPLWEDGHRWAAFVTDDEYVTMLYSAFVPNGFVEAAILVESSDGLRDILIHERTPSQMRALTLRYEGPGKAVSVSGAYYTIESWLPGSARLVD